MSEWTYITKDGTTVLLCTGEDRSMILADLPNSFLSLAVCKESEDAAPFTKEELEEFADLFSYTIIAKIR